MAAISIKLKTLLVLVGLFATCGQLARAQATMADAEALAKKMHWKPTVAPPDANYRLLQGWVVESYDQSPVAEATMTLVQGEKILLYAITDSQGHFAFEVPKEMERVEELQMVVSYGGITSVKMPLELESDVFVVYAELDVVLPPVTLTTSSTPCGYPPCGCYIRYLHTVHHSDAVLYRPLDEWLMMHSSEIQHGGRW